MSTELLLPADHVRMDHAGFIYEILFKGGMLRQLNRFPDNREMIKGTDLDALTLSHLEAKLMRWRETGSSESETRPIERLLETLHYQVTAEAESTFSALIQQFHKLHDKGPQGCVPQLLKLHAPVNLSDLQIDHDQGWIDTERRDLDADAFYRATGWNREDSLGLGKGQAGRADWLALYRLKAADPEIRAQDKGHLVLHVGEFSLFAGDYIRPDRTLKDFDAQFTHLDMLRARIAHVDDQSVYQKINLNTSELSSVLSPGSLSTLLLSATVSKSLYKLCQAASYAVDALQRIARYEPELFDQAPKLTLLCHAFTNRNHQAISITFKTRLLKAHMAVLQASYGPEALDTLSNRIDIGDGRWPLMVNMARAYRTLGDYVDTRTEEGVSLFRSRYNEYARKVAKRMGQGAIRRFIHGIYKDGVAGRAAINEGQIRPQWQERAREIKPTEKETNPRLIEANLGFESSFTEILNDYCNPAAPFTQEQVDRCFPPQQPVDADVLSHFGDPPREIIARHRAAYEARYQGARDYTSRDAHAALIEAFLERAPAGKINLLFLEGHPGVGKTTTIQNTLLEHPIFRSDGFMAMYFSPRIVINGDLHHKFAYQENGENTDICTLTCDSYINRSFQSSLKSLIEGTSDQTWTFTDAEAQLLRKLTYNKSSCVCCSGVDLKLDDSGQFKSGLPSRQNNEKVLILYDKLYNLIKSETETRVHKTTRIDQHSHAIDLEQGDSYGVFKSIAIAQRELMRLNPAHSRFLVTGSIQGLKPRTYPDGRAGTTIDAFDELFEYKVDSRSKLCTDISEDVKRERRALLKRMPTLLVMVDELTGDSAGSILVDALYSWIYRNFVLPLAEDETQFKVLLVVADASLTNEHVMNAYFEPVRKRLASQPAQVLVSDAEHESELSIATFPVNVSSAFNSRRFNEHSRCGHVKTNAFPARSLSIEHKVITHLRQRNHQIKADDNKTLGRLHRVCEKGRTKAYLAKAVYEALLRNHEQGVEQQILLFYQDKRGLDEIEEMLLKDADTSSTFDEVLGPECDDTLSRQITERGLWLTSDDIMIVNNTTMQNPALRQEITSEATRQRVKVFLVTSTLSRGISLPKANTIIAHNQQFSIESGLAELNQVIFRCRGRYQEKGRSVNSDLFEKYLVMVSEHTEELLPPDPSEPIGNLNAVRLKKGHLSLVTHLSLVQSSVLTRIYGYSDLSQGDPNDQRRVSIVPVGPVGLGGVSQPYAEKFVNMVNDLERLSVNRHFKAATASTEKDMTAVVKVLIEQITEIFSNQTISGSFGVGEQDTGPVDDRIDQHYFERASKSQSLVQYDASGRTFDHDRAVKGGLIMMPLVDVMQVDFSLSRLHVQTLKQINAVLYRLMKEVIRPSPRLNRDFGDLCSHILDFLSVFKRSDLEDENASYIETVRTGHHYLVVPAAYPMLKRSKEAYSEDWPITLFLQSAALSYGANPIKLIAPLVGVYDKQHERGYPFIIIESTQHPANWEMLLGDKALMSTRELNIMSLVL